MHLLKQFFTLLVLGIFIISNFGTALAIDDRQREHIFKVVTLKSDLKKIKNGQKYVNSIDKIIRKYENNENTLVKLEKKLEKINKKLSGQTSKKSQDMKKIIHYLDAKVDFALYKIETKTLTAEDILNDSNISQSERKTIEDKLVTLQLNLFEKGTSKLEDFLEDFDEYTNVEEKGSLKMNFDLDHESVGNIASYFNLNNYTVSSSNFDSQIKGHIDAMIDASIKGEDELKMEFRSFLDFISKDGNMYILLKDLNIVSEEEIAELEEIFEQAKKFAQENKYIKFGDENSQQVITLLNSITPQKILADGKSILSKPMFQPYKKQGDKYYLIPTKYGCDKMKELAHKFDPWNGNSCSQSQYNDIIEELAQVGNIYIELENTTKLGFESKFNSSEDFNTYIKFTDTSIEEIFAKVEEKGSHGGEASLHYIKNNKLDIIAFEKSDNKISDNFKFISTLDRNNRFTFIDSYLDIDSFRENFSMEFSLVDNIIDGNIKSEIKRYSYDYNTDSGSYLPSKEYNGYISGITKSDNSLKDLEFTYNAIDLETNKEELSGKFTYDTPSFSFTNYYNDDYIRSDFELSGTWNTYQKNFSAFDFNFDAQSSYGGEAFEAQLSLKNKILSGGASFVSNGEELFILTSNGEYEKNHLKLNNKVDFGNSIMEEFQYALNNNTGGEATVDIEDLELNINIDSDQRNNNNNSSFYIDLLINTQRALRFEIDNNSKRIYKNINIKAPSNYIDIEDLNN